MSAAPSPFLLLLDADPPEGPAGVPAAVAGAGRGTEPPAGDEAILVQAEPARLLDWLAARAPSAVWTGGPLSLFGPPPTPEQAAALLAAGVTSWWPSGTPTGPALAMDRARWEAGRAAREDAAKLRIQLDERKWIDRAKGVLMEARGIGENAAFGLLRGAAMHASLRLVDVSRSVTEAAQWADALNRAGQLRMLSQRLLRLAAQACEAPDARPLRAARDDALRRVDDILERLRALAGAGSTWLPLLDRTAAACAALRQALPARPGIAALALADACADTMLATAEELLAALETASGRRALQIVNLCGRQRMRVQRVAKQALLAHLLADAARRDSLPAVLDEFEAAIHELERAPLSSPEIQAGLAESRDQWLRLLRGLHGLDKPEGRQALVQASDALLNLFERLTADYERSLQVIMA